MALLMNTLLGILDHSKAIAMKELSDYARLFKDKQGMFRGCHNTHVGKNDYPDDPTKQKVIKVQTTVDEELFYMLNDNDPKHGALPRFLKLLFSVEATNSMGAKRVPLIVDGRNFGELTALELMRLKDILTNDKLDAMIQNIPTRSDGEVWTKADGDYANRAIYQTPQVSGVTRTTETEEIILKDPNIDPAHLPANYQSRPALKKKTVETGNYTTQNFSGEWTQTQRAYLMSRKSLILNAVIQALKDVNTTEAQHPNLKVTEMLDYLFYEK